MVQGSPVRPWVEILCEPRGRSGGGRSLWGGRARKKSASARARGASAHLFVRVLMQSVEAENVAIQEPKIEDFGPTEQPGPAWRRAFISPTFALEFVTVALMAAIPEFVLPQHKRPIPVQMINGTWARAWMLDNSYGPDTVSSAALLLIATLVPLAVAILLSFVSPARGGVKAWLHSYLWMMGTHIMVVSCIKAYCGYWRPYFLNECGFDDQIGQCTAKNYNHAFRSFPSGHASNSVGPLLHTSLRLMGALRVGYTPRSINLGCGGLTLELDGVLTMLCLVPTFLAAWIAASRVHDHAHHPADVVGGALIGAGAAVLWHMRYFHSLFGPHAHRPRAQ
jgi:membrane-associated phospholipid phosphatase